MTKSRNFLVPWVCGVVPWEVHPGQQNYTIPILAGQPATHVIQWKPNDSFKAAFKPNVGMFGANRIEMVNTANDSVFWMRRDDFENAFVKTAIVYGVMVGEWEIRKTNGKYYGLRLI